MQPARADYDLQLNQKLGALLRFLECINSDIIMMEQNTFAQLVAPEMSARKIWLDFFTNSKEEIHESVMFQA